MIRTDSVESFLKGRDWKREALAVHGMQGWAHESYPIPLCQDLAVQLELSKALQIPAGQAPEPKPRCLICHEKLVQAELVHELKRR